MNGGGRSAQIERPLQPGHSDPRTHERGLEAWTPPEPVPSMRNLEASRVRPLMFIALPGLTSRSTGPVEVRLERGHQGVAGEVAGEGS